MTEAIYLSQCASCLSPHREEINRRMKRGDTLVSISAWLKAEGAYISRNSLGVHKSKHLRTEVEQARARQAAVLAKQAKTLKTPIEDIAVLVRDTVGARLAAGDVAPTVAEGLRAQEILDRRAEKGADRSLALRIAAVIAGAYLPDAEGEYREVEPEPVAGLIEA